MKLRLNGYENRVEVIFTSDSNYDVMCGERSPARSKSGVLRRRHKYLIDRPIKYSLNHKSQQTFLSFCYTRPKWRAQQGRELLVPFQKRFFTDANPSFVRFVRAGKG